MAEIIAVTGEKNAGKTCLIEALIPALAKRGLRAAVIKHDGHRFEPDREGTDSFRALAAGAVGAAVFDGEKFQLVKYGSVSERDLASFFPEADVILLEGLKRSALPKIEVVCGDGVPVSEPETRIALVTDGPLRQPGVPVFSPGNVEALADHLTAYLKSRQNGG